MTEGCVIKNEPLTGVLRCSERGILERHSEEEEGFARLLREEREKAFARGQEEGEKRGYAKGKEEMEAFLQLLQTISEKLLEEKKALFHHLKPQIIEFSILLAERVMRIELSQPEKLAKLIETLLSHIAFQGEVVKIFLACEDLVMMEEKFARLNYDKKEIKGLRFASDTMQKRGDVRIETKSAILNFSLARELEDLRSKVLRG